MIGDISKIQKDELNALIEKLGAAGTIVFLRQFESSGGNYADERENSHMGLTVDDITARIRQRKAGDEVTIQKTISIIEKIAK